MLKIFLYLRSTNYVSALSQPGAAEAVSCKCAKNKDLPSFPFPVYRFHPLNLSFRNINNERSKNKRKEGTSGAVVGCHILCSVFSPVLSHRKLSVEK